MPVDTKHPATANGMLVSMVFLQLFNTVLWCYFNRHHILCKKGSSVMCRGEALVTATGWQNTHTHTKTKSTHPHKRTQTYPNIHTPQNKKHTNTHICTQIHTHQNKKHARTHTQIKTKIHIHTNAHKHIHRNTKYTYTKAQNTQTRVFSSFKIHKHIQRT